MSRVCVILHTDMECVIWLFVYACIDLDCMMPKLKMVRLRYIMPDVVSMVDDLG